MEKVSMGLEPLGHQDAYIPSLNWVDWASASCNSAPIFITIQHF
jgi:hypothetical protein